MPFLVKNLTPYFKSYIKLQWVFELNLRLIWESRFCYFFQNIRLKDLKLPDAVLTFKRPHPRFFKDILNGAFLQSVVPDFGKSS